MSMEAAVEAEAAAPMSEIELLRSPFGGDEIDILPKPLRRDAEKGSCDECGGWHSLPAIHIRYVGHARITARLLDVDETWNWEPLAKDERGLPLFDRDQSGEPIGLWIKLTVLGVTRLGYGSVDASVADAEKQLIGDAIRNAAMRFGCGLEMWFKEETNRSASGDQQRIPSETFGPCPACGKGLITKSVKRDGQIYAKCSLNRWKNKTTCQWIDWAPDFDAYNHVADEAEDTPATSSQPASNRVENLRGEDGNLIQCPGCGEGHLVEVHLSNGSHWTVCSERKSKTEGCQYRPTRGDQP